jgi:hypothetical protein
MIHVGDDGYIAKIFPYRHRSTMPALNGYPSMPARFEHLRGSERIRYGHVTPANECESSGECWWRTAIRAIGPSSAVTVAVAAVGYLIEILQGFVGRRVDGLCRREPGRTA